MSTSPEEPSAHVVNELERLNAELPPQSVVDPEKPWWLPTLCVNRDEFYATALFDMDSHDERIFIFLFAVQKNMAAWFLEGREVPHIVGGAGCEVEGAEDLPWGAQIFEFISPLVLLPDHRLPFEDDGNIGVRRERVFRGRQLCAMRRPIRFEEFVSCMPQRHAPPRDGARRVPRMTPGLIDDLLLEHPWLERGDLEGDPRPPRAVRQAGRAAARGSPRRDDAADAPEEFDDVGGEPPDEEIEAEGDGEGDDLGEELPVVREHVGAFMDEHPELYFRVVARGGDWTLRHIGRHANEVRAEARGEISLGWCRWYAYPRSATFSMARYTLHGATRFAREWARRSTYFIRMYLEAPNPDTYEYAADASADYEEDPEYLDFVLAHDVESAVMRRAHEMRALEPGYGADLEDEEG